LLTVIGVSSASAADEAVLPAKFQKEILPYFESARIGSIVGKDGVRLAWRSFLPAQMAAGKASYSGARAIILLNGRSEFMHKYAELVYDLRESGYAIYMMDHRGQGESGRLLAESRIGHVKDFHDYVDDLGIFLKEVVLKDSPSELHLIAHSMGATIASIYAIEHPDVFNSMVFSAPMVQPNLGKYPEFVALGIAGFMDLIGKSRDLAPGRTLDEWLNPFEANNVTQSRARYAYVIDLLKAHPEYAIGGPSYRWVAEAIRGSQWVRRHAGKLVTPVRFLQASDDHVVVNRFQNEVCAQAKNCDLRVLNGSMHEMFIETDAHRNQAIQLTRDWIQQHSAHFVK